MANALLPAKFCIKSLPDGPHDAINVGKVEGFVETCSQLRRPNPIQGPILPGAAVSSSAQTIMNRKKILIVDDNAIFLKAVSMKLSASGYDVLTAEDGGSAVSLARREKPDLILLDISFPPDVAHGGGVPWDGFLIMSWLRRMDELKSTPIIIVTGGDPLKYKDRCLKEGAAAFFHKPVNNEELLAVIRQHLGESNGQPQPHHEPEIKPDPQI